MARRAIIALLLWLTPRRWRDSIAGDLEEASAGAVTTLAGGVLLLARLWFEELSIARTAPKRPGTMQSLGFQLRQAARSLVSRPAYSLIVIATLAIGIGATAAVFGLANWLLFRPLPGVHEPSRLTTVRLGLNGGLFFLSHPELEIVRSHVHALQDIAGSNDSQLNVAIEGGEAYRVNGGIVSANYFEVLGVRAFAGRVFSSADAGVVVSHAFWRSRLGSARDAIGRTLIVNGNPQPVLGIAPPGFAGTSRTSSIDVWVPTTLRAALFPRQRRDPLTSITDSLYLELIGRLAPGASLEDVRPALEGVPAAIARVHPRPLRYKEARFSADEGLTTPAFERERLSRVFALLTGMVAMLLLLGCANVGNVMLAAGSTRRAEIATRQAIGASRGQIVGSVLLESLLLSLCGGGVAVALAGIVSTLLRGTIVLPFIPALGEVSLDARVFTFALAVSTLSAIVAGLLPALSATRFDLLSALKGSARSVTAGGQLRRVLTMAQVALSLTLLIGALLFARSIDGRRRVDPGFDPAPLLTFSVDPSRHSGDADSRLAFYARVIEGVSATPGVVSVATSWDRPFGQVANDADVQAVNGTSREPAAADVAMVSPGYFRTMGIPLLTGREFTAADQPAAGADPRGVVILSRSLARELFGSPDAAIGNEVILHERRASVVGVAHDARLRRAFEAPPHMIYAVFGRSPSWATIHVRTAATPASLAQAMRDSVRRADPTVPIHDLLTVRDAMDRQMSEEILIGRVATAFAVIATLLAAVGLYGMLAQAVTERRMEMGIRAALGAAPLSVLRLIAVDAFWMTASGAAAGSALAAWLTRYLESRLFGVERFDPVTFMAALAMILFVAIIASLVPALRAARVDPVIALRQ